MTNEELLHQYYDGDDSAFESLYRRNLGFIKKVAVEAATDFHCVQYQTADKEKYTTYTGTILNDLCAEGRRNSGTASSAESLTRVRHV